MSRPIVDPRFGQTLRRLRVLRGLSLRDLAAILHRGKSHLQEFETGVKTPRPEVAQQLDEALQAGGQLAAMVRESNGALTDDDRDRLAYVTRHPRRIDPATVQSLADILAQQRRLEDVIGSAAMVQPALSQLNVIEGLVVEARDPIRPALVDVAAQWAQFAGWLQATSDRPGRARGWYAHALEWATEVGNIDMVATALNLRGHLAWKAGQPGPLIGLSAAALRQPASPGVRALAAQQLARGHALVGDRVDVDRILDEAAALAAAATEHPENEPPWVYFFDAEYLRMQRGIVYRLLGQHERAIEHVRAGLASMPPDVRRSEWVGEYVLLLVRCHAALGDRVEAGRMLDEARAIATATGSERMSTQVEQFAVRLSADG